MNFILTPNFRLRVISTLCVLALLLMGSTLAKAQCSLACGANTNISVDEFCMADITYDVLLLDESSCDIAASFEVVIEDAYGNAVPNPVDGSVHMGNTLSVSVVALDAAGAILNTCWGYVLIEDKLAPVPQCSTVLEEYVVVTCTEADVYAPIFEDACDGSIEGSLVIEMPKQEICEGTAVYDEIAAAGFVPEDYNFSITKIYSAQDSKGNVAEQCTIQVLVERVDLDNVVDPPNFEYSTSINTALNCDGTWSTDCLHANFAGEFAPANFTVTVEGPGNHVTLPSFDFTDAPACVTVAGASNGTNDVNSATQVCVDIPCDGFVSFDWVADMSEMNNFNGVFNNDDVNYSIDGVLTPLTTDLLIGDDQGTELGVAVTVGQEFCFVVNSNNRGEFAFVEICNLLLSDQYGIVLTEDTDGDGLLDSDNGIWDDNNNDYPDPLEVGVPTLGGVNLWPLSDDKCSIGLYYTDQEYPVLDGCKRQILRIWEIREWYCGEELSITIPQTIIIKDFEAPVVTCDDVVLTEEEDCLGYETITTNIHGYSISGSGSTCGATYLPRVPEITDNCSTEFEIDVQFTQMETGNAGFVDDWDTTTEIELDMGLTMITFFVYDNCHNVGECSYIVNVVDNTPPTPICDQNTVVSLTTTGEAFVYASSFDDGSHDDCELKKILVRRMDTECECDAPVYPDATFLGEYDGHLYYHSSYTVDWFKASDLSVAMGGYLVDFGDSDEESWVEEAVEAAGGDAFHYEYEGCDDKLELLPYVMEIEDPCTFGTKVKFCCADVDDEDIMVVLRAVDKYGNFNDCMVNVDVQDKIGPNIECGPDVVVPCDFPFDVNDPDFTHVDGVGATATNHCGDDLTPVPTYNIVDGPCGNTDFIEVTFTVEDGDGNSTSCVQIIDFEDPTDITEDNIEWPEELVEIDMCDDPSSIGTDVSGLPTYVGINACNVLAYNYTDVVFYLNNNEPDACFKIRRTWTVIDWCSTNQYVFVQTIKAVNDVAPEITGDCAPITECTEEGECFANITLSQSATDTDCTLPENLLWTAYIDFDNDGSFDGDLITTTGPTLEITETFPIGTHKIKWQVDDRCGNSDVCVQEITVVPCNIPSIYCTSPALVLPLGSEGEVEIWVTDWACTADLQCDLDAILSFSETEIVTNVTYSCDDLDPGTTSTVLEQTIYAISYDQNGNIISNEVIVTAEIQDNSGVCDTSVQEEEDESDNARHAISGLISLEDGRILSEVEVVLDGSSSVTLTDQAGSYQFPEMENGGYYTIMPDKDDAYPNGISTLDILVLQRHILNLESLQSPYQVIAADVNNDGVVSAADIVDIRKLVLEYYTEYPQNSAWRFVDMQYAFIDNNNPLAESFTEDYEIPNLSTDMIVNFIAMKVGDLNNSVEVSGFAGEESEVRNSTLFELTLEEAATQYGNIEIPVYANQDVYGFQFTIDYSGDDLSITGIKPGAMDINTNNYRVIDNSVAISYNTPSAISYSTDDVAFYITAETNNGADLSKFEISNEGIDAQAYDSNMEIIKPVIGNTVQVESGFALYQNTPNPFTGRTDISFKLPQTMEAELTIRDITGKVIYRQGDEFSKGMNTVSIQRSQLSTSGIYYYSIEAGNYTETRKMVLLN